MVQPGRLDETADFANANSARTASTTTATRAVRVILVGDHAAYSGVIPDHNPERAHQPD